ncbi:MAG: endo-1,4-beta-xylanase [Promethearchaeota archaeon]
MTNKNCSSRRRIKILFISWSILLAIFVGFTAFDMISPYTMPASINEDKLLSDARARILQIRRGTYTLNFGPENGGKIVHVRQLSHEFKFGANTYQYEIDPDDEINEIYATRFSELFNYGTVPFYWSGYQPVANESNIERKQYLHDITLWLASFNATPKGHPVIWQYPPTTPSWLKEESDITDAVLQHVRDVLLSFPEINIWDLVNEMTHVENSWLGQTPEETWKTALREARKIRPECIYIANEYNTVDRGDPAKIDNDAGRFYRFVEHVVADGYAPDALGFQFHSIDRWQPLTDILDTFNAFGRFQIPCHVTEFIPASNGVYSSGSRRGLITEQSQAEWAVRAYTMLFSHPAIDAITWWDVGYKNSWKPELGCYMIDENGRLLPVYNAIMDLIHVQWNSTGDYILDDQGKMNFTGFYGQYQYTVGDGELTGNFSLLNNKSLSERIWHISY